MPRQIDGLTLYTTEEVAAMLGTTAYTVRLYLRQGRIQGRRFANRWYIPADALIAYFRQPDDGQADDGDGAV